MSAAVPMSAITPMSAGTPMSTATSASDAVGSGIALVWLPLGAGQPVVAFSGRTYERLVAWRGRRPPLALYHAALEVTTPEASYAVELAPVPDSNGHQRGVVCTGAVGSRLLGRLRWFRYELRCWPGGTLPDRHLAVASPIVVARGTEPVARLLAMLPHAPTLVWGRDSERLGEMWNSNAVIAWLLAVTGLLSADVRLPPGGRAPGWDAGLRFAAGESDHPDRRRTPPEAPRMDDQRPTCCPLTLSLAAPIRMLNLELPDHPVYDAAELLWFDDAERGTGMLAFLTRREGRVVDHYVSPGLRLDPESFHIGGGTRSWNVTEIDPARLEVTADGVVAQAGFVDTDGRRIELDIDDRDGRPRRRARMLAPVSDGIPAPQSLFVVWMPSFDLVRATPQPATIRIDGEDVETVRIPLEPLHRQRVIKYTDALVAIEVNRDRPARDGQVAADAADVAEDREPGTSRNDEVITTPDGRAIRAVLAGRDGHQAALLLWPPLPDPTTMADGDAAAGRWGLKVDGDRLVAGPWSARRTGDEVALVLDTDTPWRPGRLPWLLRALTIAVPSFRRWPTTYRWHGTVSLGDTPCVTGRWERTEPTRRR